MNTHPYPSDLTDEEWIILGPLIIPGKQAGHPQVLERRRVADAVFYLSRTGCQWRAVPHGFPPWSTVFYHQASLASVLGASKAGFYDWLRRPPSAHAAAEAVLLERIKAVHAGSRGIYGSQCVHAALRASAEKHSRKRIERLMREAGLAGASHRRGGPTTTCRDQEARPAPDLVDRDFKATGPNQLWTADITFIPTTASFLYLAVMLDAWSRKIVGWAMAIHLRDELALDTLVIAVGQRRPCNVTHHSDHHRR